MSLGFSSSAPADGGAFDAAGLDSGAVTATWETFSFSVNTPVQPMTSVVQASYALDAASDLVSALQQNFVVTSLDADPYGDQVLSAVVSQSDTMTYTSNKYSDTTAGLAAWAASEGASSKIVTALAPSTQGIVAYAFSLSGDSSTYDTTVQTASYTGLAATISSMASAGYVVTAMGLSAYNSFVLVGTRKHGDTTMHTTTTGTIALNGSGTLSAAMTQGYAAIGYAVDPATTALVVFLEK